MAKTFSLNHPMQSIFWPAENRLVKNSLLVIGGAIALALASQLSIPLSPVPFSFQNLMVLLIGMVYGSRLGFATIMTYLVAGVMGMPVFAEFSAGAHVLMGVTGGYLLGFIPAVLVAGFLTQQGFAKNYFLAFIAAMCGLAIISALGVTQLSAFIGWQAAWIAGAKPFIMMDLLKCFAAALIAKQLWHTR